MDWPRAEIHVERYVHTELPRDLLVRASRVAAIVKIASALERFEIHHAGGHDFAVFLHLDRLIRVAQLVPAFPRDFVTGVERNRRAQIGTSLHHSSGNGIALGVIHVILHEPAACDVAPKTYSRCSGNSRAASA